MYTSVIFSYLGDIPLQFRIRDIGWAYPHMKIRQKNITGSYMDRIQTSLGYISVQVFGMQLFNQTEGFISIGKSLVLVVPSGYLRDVCSIMTISMFTIILIYPYTTPF